MSTTSRGVAQLTAGERERLERMMLERAASGRPSSIPRRPDGPDAPLSFAQQRLWFLAQLDPQAAAYNMVAAFRLRGALDAVALERSLGEVVRRHQALRTVFLDDSGSPRQRVLPYAGFTLSRHALVEVAPDERAAALRRFAAGEVSMPFDLGQGPLLRAALVNFGEQDHGLVLCLHHIASDGWSASVLARELTVLYATFVRGAVPSLPELPVQYADFAVWQRESLSGRTLEQSLDFWRKALRSPLPALELPADRPRPPVQSFRGARHDFMLNAAVRGALLDLARRQGATPFVLLLAAFRALLHRYTGQVDLVVGVPEANRNRSEIEGLIGFFANTLALRGDLSGDPTFLEVLERERVAFLAARSHQDVPFEKLVEDLRPDREMSRNPLFQILFAYSGPHRPPVALAGLEVEAVHVDPGTVRVDLELHLFETPDGLGGAFRYSTDLFDAARIERMAGHFEVLLAALVADPDRRLSRLPILTDGERHLLLESLNETAGGYEGGKTLHGLFEAWASRKPDAVALESGSSRLSYGELDARAERVAEHLRELGVGPEVRVGVYLSRSPDLLVGLLGVLKAGGAYVPLDPAYPHDRVAYMIEDSQTAVILTETGLLSALGEAKARIVCLDRDLSSPAERATDGPRPRVDPENLAYVIYTSGSTGRPKGVAITHRSAVVLAHWTEETLGTGDLDGVLASTSICFDVSVFELFVPLAHGGRVVLAENALSVAETPLPGVRLISTVPSAIAELLRLGAIPDSVRTVCIAGEPLSASLASRLYESGIERVFDLYGPSEDTTYSTFALRAPEGPETIGRPIADTRIYILDRSGEPLPLGVPGELCIGGLGLARGYLNQPSLTAERFVPDPFSLEPGARLYQTGDLARYLADGRLECLGRIDHQVKVRGHRIELDEIEAVLAEVPAVQELVVVVREDTPGDRRIVAYVAGKAGVALEERTLVGHLRGQLPAYMIPSAFVVLPALPRTPNGKVSRAALPAPRFDSAAPARDAREPTPEEGILAGIFAETLGAKRVGLDEGFFDLGGHSLLATRVIARAREAFGIEIPLRWLFERPTVAGLAEAVTGASKSDGAPAPSLGRRARPGGPAPLSFGQQRLWLLQEMEPDSSLYNVSVTVRMCGALNVSALESSLRALLDRHETLRTRFERATGAVVQRVEPVPAGWCLATVDLEARLEAERAAEVERHVREERQRPFVLSQSPSLRATLLRVGSEEHVLLLVLHHAAADGWSVGVLVRELGELYAARLAGRDASLPELKVQYADFAAWQRDWLRGEALESRMSYWRGRLAGMPETLDLRAERPPTEQRRRGGRVEGTLPNSLREGISTLARRESATPFMVLLSGFQALLARYSGQTDVVVGSPIAGRTFKDLEPLVGFFVNMLVLRTDLSGDPTVRELVRRARETALGAYTHQDLPFEKLVEELNPERAPGRHPLFQVVFALQNAPREALDLPGLSLAWVSPEEDTTPKYDLQAILTEAGDGSLRVSLRFDRDLFEPAAVERMLGHYQRLLEGMVSRPEARVSDLPILGDQERRLLLEGWSAPNASAVPPSLLPAGALVHEAFAERANARPQALALADASGSMTYGALEASANQWARALRERGVAPEVRVGLLVGHGPRLALGALAVLKAGGAYVALDPELPPERLSYVLRDANVRLVLTEAVLEEKIAGAGMVALCLDRDRVHASHEATPFSSGAAAENLAYVIYTSGSTGLPKGVELTHGGLLNLVRWHVGRYAVTGEDRATQVAGLGFDASVWELWPYLATGASLHFASEEERTDPRGLRAWLAREGITLTFLPTPLAEAVLQGPWPAEARLRALLTGGDRLQRRPAEGLGFALVNHYGPTENTVVATAGLVSPVSAEDRAPSIGGPITGVRACVTDERMEPMPSGLPGELLLGGPSLARGYLGRADLTAQSFVPDPFSQEPGARLYRTGDQCRYREDGSIEFVGRIDQQVKVRGHRIELGEVEAVLGQEHLVQESVVVLREDASGQKRLVAYVVWRDETTRDVASLKARLRERLPGYMVPSAFVELSRLPLNASGKVDRGALPGPEGREAGAESFVAPSSDAERAVADLWREVLGIAAVGLHDNFFDLGGHSLLLVDVHARLHEMYPEKAIRVVDLFRYPTVQALSEFLGAGKGISPRQGAREGADARGEIRREPIAVVGMAGRFPKARNLGEFWERLRSGEECITFFTEAELRASGVPEEQIRDPRYVRARGVLEGADRFDAGLFGYTPREAEVMDPQQRVFLECAWEALEDAGYGMERQPGPVGVYAGASQSTYLLNNLHRNHELLATVGGTQVKIGNDKDTLATRVAYELGLRGPALSVQTACSTSLVAVHMACQGLWSRECDTALAGGVSITVPQQVGYVYQEEGIGSPDGHCRAFDAGARGTVSGSGVGVVALKRLADALRDGDAIRAIIRGSAINNDGSEKVGFTAPSVAGQAAVIAAAQAAAGVAAGTVTFVEAHGTGTALGDPIEVEALTQAFRDETDRKGFCALGSVKSNVGHLDAAAGIAGFIKAVLALEHREIPPTLNCETPNPRIGFDATPFYVNKDLRAWSSEGPLRAGVSSFGIGGTNAHVVLEEAPRRSAVEAAGEAAQLLVLSARTPSALERAADNLREHLLAHPEQEVADVAYTLQAGRRPLAHRLAWLASRGETGKKAIQGEAAAPRVFRGQSPAGGRSVAFLFPGQGSQFVGMFGDVYREHGVFRSEFDRCCDALSLGLDLRELVLAEPGREQPSRQQRLGETWLTQPALFATEYALARLWMSLGLKPSAMLGHSVGEYVAACLAGVLSLEDAVRLVADRGRLMQSLPRGSMLAVPLGEAEARGLLEGGRLSLAAVNAPTQCVVSGPDDAVTALQDTLRSRGLEPRRLETSHAFHSAAMDPILEEFGSRVRSVVLHAPQVPFLSNVTGTWITAEQAQSAEYWVRHLRQPVRFADGLGEILRDESTALLEVGPSQFLSALARRHTSWRPERLAVCSSGRAGEAGESWQGVLAAAAQLWVGGVGMDLEALHGGTPRRRVALPTYPFEPTRYWVDPPSDAAGRARVTAAAGEPAKRTDAGSWFYTPVWKWALPTGRDRSREEESGTWLVFADTEGPGARLLERLRDEGRVVVEVRAGDSFARLGEEAFSVRPGDAPDHEDLLASLAASGRLPRFIVHAWSATVPSARLSDEESFEHEQARGLWTLAALLRALDRHTGRGPVSLTVVASHLYEVTGGEVVCPERLTLLGVCRTAPQEHQNLSCRLVDVALPAEGGLDAASLTAVVRQCAGGDPGAVTAVRGGRSWVQAFESLNLDAPTVERLRLRRGGAYLVTGGLGRVGLEIATWLAREAQARLVLVGRSEPSVRAQEKLRALEALGSEVVVVTADVADRAAMGRVVELADRRFSGVQGVFHAAGVTQGSSFARLAEVERTVAAEQFRAKVGGLRVLRDVLRGRPLDFCLVTSSLSTLLGGRGLGVYAGANACADALVARAAGDGQPWTSVSFDGWRFEDDAASGPRRAASLSLEPTEGVEALRRILGAAPLSQVVVSTGDLEQRLDRWVKRASPGVDVAPVSRLGAHHARPDLSEAYVGPRTPTEAAIAAMWQDLFGLQTVGVHDDFFDLGGDSLVATRLTTRLREAFGVEVSLRTLFEAPTVAALAGQMDAAAVPDDRAGRVAALVQRLRDMSPEEKRQLVEEEKRSREAVS